MKGIYNGQARIYTEKFDQGKYEPGRFLCNCMIQLKGNTYRWVLSMDTLPDRPLNLPEKGWIQFILGEKKPE